MISSFFWLGIWLIFFIYYTLFGLLMSNAFSIRLPDMFGRKKDFFLSLLVVIKKLISWNNLKKNT
jgi:ABC-type Na+ efflux pump permease subunit